MNNEIQDAVNEITAAVDAAFRRKGPKDLNAVWRSFAMGYSRGFIESNFKVLQDAYYAAELRGVKSLNL